MSSLSSELAQRTVSLPMSQEQAAKFKGPPKIQYREMPRTRCGLIAFTTASF